MGSVSELTLEQKEAVGRIGGLVLMNAMILLNLRRLTPMQLGALARGYDRLRRKELLPFPRMAGDPTRIEVDRTISRVLGLPDLSPLREMLAREPFVCLEPLGVPRASEGSGDA